MIRVTKRTRLRKILDTLTFPLRAVTLFSEDKWGLSSLSSERYEYVAREVSGYCLDVGCGPHNRFITQHLSGHGKGIDVFPYEGLTDAELVKDIRHFPFDDASFDSVTLIASINHIPKPLRDIEISEAYRCLKAGGNIIVTMGHPLAELLAHKIVWLYDKVFKTAHDVDSLRGMAEEEAYYLTDREIVDRLTRAGFEQIRKKRFWTQWGLNHLLVGWKR